MATNASNTLVTLSSEQHNISSVFTTQTSTIYSGITKIPDTTDQMQRNNHSNTSAPVYTRLEFIIGVPISLLLVILFIILVIIHVKRKRSLFLERRRKRQEATKMFFETNEFESANLEYTNAHSNHNSTTRLNRYFVQKTTEVQLQQPN